MTDFYKCLSSEFTRWVVDNDYLESDFVILDVGVQGGHHPRWNVLGQRLSVYGFDPLREEIETLRAAHPEFHYFDMAVGDEDGTQTLYVTETLWTSSFYKPPPQRNNRIGGSDPTLEEREVITRRIDTLVSEGVIPPPDFVKMDVEGHEPKVILGGSEQLGSGAVLAVESESGFTAHPDAPLSHFALISEPLHRLGFYLYNIGLLHATKRPLALGRPRITPGLDIYFSPIGRPQTIDVLFCRDGVTEDWADIPATQISDRLLKMAIILELYNLNDCAIELLQHVASDPSNRDHLRFPVKEAIDRLVPKIQGNRFIGDLTGDLGLELDMDFATYSKINELIASRQRPEITITQDNNIRLIDNSGRPIPFSPEDETDAKQGSDRTIPVEPTRLPVRPPNAGHGSTGTVLNKAASLADSMLPRNWRKKRILPNGTAVDNARRGRGWLDSTFIGHGTVKLAGWAVDNATGCPADRILFFADGRLVQSCNKFIERPDVAASLGKDQFLKSGFDVYLPKRELGEIDGLTLKVFAATANGTFELNYPEDYPFAHGDVDSQLNLRASSFIDQLLKAEDRRRLAAETDGLLRPKKIVVDQNDTVARLDRHVPTFTDASAKTRISGKRIGKDRRAVIVTFGQSNIANHGDTRYRPKNEFYNFDFLTGDLYHAEDPLLGASGDLGNVATRLGDKLIEKNVFKSVVLAPLALGGSTIAEWTPEGYAHRRLLVALKRLRDLDMNPTHFLWHQGESDVVAETTQSAYEYAFRQIVESLRDHGAYAPIFVAVASRCGNNGSEQIRAAQHALPNPHYNIFRGPNTDKLGPEYRFDDCHFSDRGLDAHADLWLDAIVAASRA